VESIPKLFCDLLRIHGRFVWAQITLPKNSVKKKVCHPEADDFSLNKTRRLLSGFRQLLNFFASVESTEISCYIALQEDVKEMSLFSVLSLNTFGVPFYLSSGRIRRLTAELERLAPTILCLQEIQQNAYLPLLQQGLTTYSHSVFFHNRFAPKGGLFTASVSNCPLMQSVFFPFLNQGRLMSIGFSDWALNKGVLLVSLEVDGHCFVVMNTHLQANYLADWRRSNLQTQIQLDQVDCVAELVHAQPKDAWVIVCGDFNFPRQTPAYQRMITQSRLMDALSADRRPTYLPLPLIPAKWRTSLDYIFYRMPVGEALHVRADIIPVVNSSAQRSFQRFLTDHLALRLNIG
jgi:endonuclease/exonuclease/phosphatase family metal-dependent hydrolase